MELPWTCATVSVNVLPATEPNNYASPFEIIMSPIIMDWTIHALNGLYVRSMAITWNRSFAAWNNDDTNHSTVGEGERKRAV